MSKTPKSIAMQVASDKGNYHRRRSFRSPLRPLVTNDHELDSRRAQSAAIASLVTDFMRKQDERKKEKEGV
jgi:hypothetical protein